jgi:hypothetical protein
MIIIAVAEAAKIATRPATEYQTATAEMAKPENRVSHGIKYLSLNVSFRITSI